MKIACNWSEELASLPDEILDGVDYFKAGAIGGYEKLFGHIRESRPILLHGLGMKESAGMSGVCNLDFAKINALLDFCGSPHVGIHLSIQSADVAETTDIEDIAIKMVENLKVFKKNIKIPVLAENTPDCSRDREIFGHYPFYDAGLISWIVKTADIGFLLDISHARVACMYNNINICDYLQGLPLEYLREIHVNGIGYDNQGVVMDSHAAMTEDDFALLRWVLNRASPEIVTLEYGWQMKSEYCAAPAPLRENLERLLALKQSILKKS